MVLQFLPPKKGRQTRLKELALEPRTMIFYESPHRIVRTLMDFFNASLLLRSEEDAPASESERYEVLPFDDEIVRLEADEAAARIVKGLESSQFDIHFPSRFTRILKAISLLPDTLRFKLVGKASRNQQYSTSSEHQQSINASHSHTELRRP